MPLEIAEAHVMTRFSLFTDQWCTSGTKRELAEFILDGLAKTPGAYMKTRYSVEDIIDRLSEPVDCQDEAGTVTGRHHYLFAAGRLSYTP